MKRVLSFLALAALVSLPAWTQRYKGPVPDKADVPFLVHADNLLPLEEAEASQSQQKDVTTYTVSGTQSPARTPLAEPVFLLKTDKNPEQLSLYPFELKSGQRQVSFNQKKAKDNPRPVRFSITRLDEHLYRLEVQQYLENGEYAFSPDGSNAVFCFQVY
jgi:hypothetical protein